MVMRRVTEEPESLAGDTALYSAVRKLADGWEEGWELLAALVRVGDDRVLEGMRAAGIDAWVEEALTTEAESPAVEELRLAVARSLR
jgi:hypothetical protein